MKRKSYLFALLFICVLSIANGQKNSPKAYRIPVTGNAFEIGCHSGISTVGSEFATISSLNLNATHVYFKLQVTGDLLIGIKGKSKDSNSAKIKAGFMGDTKEINFTNTERIIDLKSFSINAPGYYHVELSGISGAADISDIIVSGSATDSGVIYSNHMNYHYWARRGPSCHLSYTIPTPEKVSYYYNEIVVPKGEDVVGSYFMANGFGQGYFGIQVNSPTERRILFSVWSPFHTDDPKSIPKEDRIQLLKKGKDVYIGEFGNEGSGGQSYLKYNWKACKTYKFLLKGVPDGKGNTDFTAWFMPEYEKEWELIASFKRPKTDSYLTKFHSFLENFIPNQGYLSRQVDFNNQWVYDGAWRKVESAKLTVDATYRANQRVDATGGVTSKGYYLKMGGFFNDIVEPGTIFQFDNMHNAPKVDFEKLP